MNYLRKIIFCFAVSFICFCFQEFAFANVTELTKKLEKTAFETEVEYRNRVKPLLATFNQSVDQKNTAYAAGQVILNDKLYDITTELFALKVEWTDWAIPLTVIEDGLIKVSRDEAKSLFENSAGQALLVFMTLILGEKKPLPEKFLLLGNGKMYEILLGGGAGTPADLLNPKKDPFESDAQFQARRQRLVDYYNAAVERHDPAFQAGTVTLKEDNYDMKMGRFPISIVWKDWAEKLSIPSWGYIVASRNEALTLWKESTEKAVFSILSPENVVQPRLIGLGKIWTIKTLLPPSHEWKSIKAHTESYKTISDLAFSPDGQLLLSGSYDNTLKLWDIAIGKQVRIFSGHKYSVYSVAYSPDGLSALSGGLERTMKLWEVSTGKLIRSFQGHTSGVSSVAFSPDGRTALSGSSDNTMNLWDVSSGRLIRSFQGHTNFVVSVAYSPDGLSALSGSFDNTMNLWEVSTGRLIRSFQGHTNHVNSVAYSPDGRTALSGSSDNTMNLWEVSTGRLIRSFQGHTSNVLSVAYSPDGFFIVSGNRDTSVKLWDVSSGKLIRSLTGHKNGVLSVAFSPDGTLASGDFDGVIKLWK